MNDLKSCPGCGWPKVRLIGKTQTKDNESGFVAIETYEQDEGIYGSRTIENTISMKDFRHGFYCRCNRCGWKSPTVWTPWHIRTKGEADQWNRNEKYFGFEQDSEWAKPYREEAQRLWNKRYEHTCHMLFEHRGDPYCKCDVCRTDYDAYEDIIFEKDGSTSYAGNYCKICGSKVVEE